jgi:hypothetical protein
MFVLGAEKSHQAKAGAVIDPTCTSSLPCIEYDNNSTGPGVRGISLHGNGLAGTTRVISSSPASGRAGVLGNDTSASGGGNAGVRGLSSIGDGVFGQSNTGIGLFGTSTNFFGVEGTSSADDGVFGFSGNANGVEGDTFSTLSTNAGVQGSNGAFSIAIRAKGFGGPLFVGNNNSATDVFTVDNSGNITIAGLIFTGGTCSTGCAPKAASPGVHIVSYAPREAQPTMEDFGEARLVSGQAYVKLDPAFANVIDQRASYLVFITAEGDNKGLYVSQKSLDGFVVRESQGGHSTVAFSYRIVAKPYGPSQPRLARIMLKAQPRALRHIASWSPQ